MGPVISQPVPAAFARSHCTAAESIGRATFWGFMLKPVVNISGSTIRSVASEID